MLKETIEYENFDNEKVVEDFYFNLNKAELAEMKLIYKDGFDEFINKLVEADEVAKVLAIFREIIGKTYGQRSADGRNFRKSEKITEEFMGSNAYGELFIKFVSQEGFAAKFIAGVIPGSLQEKATSKDGEDNRPLWIQQNRDPSKAELLAMPREQMFAEMKKMSDRKNETSPDENK